MCFIFSLFKFKKKNNKKNNKKIKNTIIKTPLYFEPHLPIPLNYI